MCCGSARETHCVNLLMNLCPTLDIFHLISKNERVPVGIYFSLLDLNSSNFMLFSMKRVSRFYLICVGGFSRGFHRHLERLWQKSSLFCQYILGFPQFPIIWHVCFEKRHQLEYFWLVYFLKLNLPSKWAS